MDIVIARIVHVLAVVLWIGGVGFVTTVLFPAVRRSERLRPVSPHSSDSKAPSRGRRGSASPCEGSAASI
jgi:hypothetical protein